jgi:hypothetical protein
MDTLSPAKGLFLLLDTVLGDDPGFGTGDLMVT